MKRLVQLSLAGLIMVSTMAMGSVAQADTTITNTPGSSKASFDIQNGELTAAQTTTDSQFDFGSIKLSDFASAKRAKTALQSTSKLPQFVISNFDSTVKNWSVTAEASPFTNGDATLNNVSFNLGLTPGVTKEGDQADAAATYGDDESSKAAQSTGSVDIMGNAATVLSGAPALGVTKASVDTKATYLDLSNVSLAQLATGQYTSNVTWTVNQTPAVAAAK